MKLFNLDKNDRAKLEAIILKWQNPEELVGEDLARFQAGNLILNFYYNSQGGIKETYNPIKDLDTIVKMEKTITKVLNEFKNLSAPARHVNSKYTFGEIQLELNRLKNKLKIYEQDFHQTFEGYKESMKPRNFQKVPLGLVWACMKFWVVDCRRDYPKNLVGKTDLDNFLTEVFNFFDVDTKSLIRAYKNWVEVEKAESHLDDMIHKVKRK